MTRTTFFAIACAVLTMSFVPVAQAQTYDGWRSQRTLHQDRGQHRGWNNHRAMRLDNDRDDYRNRNRNHYRAYRENCELRVAGNCVVR